MEEETTTMEAVPDKEEEEEEVEEQEEENVSDESSPESNGGDLENSPPLPPSDSLDSEDEDPKQTQNAEPVPHVVRKRRRRKKRFFTEINGNQSSSRRLKIGGSGGLAKEMDVEALIAISVGFPADSLTEEEIEANVVSRIGGNEQANYIVVRNHILALWRSNLELWLTRDHALHSIRSEHHNLVDSAYNFLLHHGYINFGLAPAIKQAKITSSSHPLHVLIVGAGLAGLIAARQLLSMGFKVLVLEGRARPGGRVSTKKMNGDGFLASADLGGSVLTGINGNPLGVLARQLGLPLHKVRDICPLYLPDGQTVNPDVDSRVEASFNMLLDRVCKLRQSLIEEVRAVDAPLGTALEAFRNAFRVAEDPQERMLLNWHLANLEYANATLMSNLSMAFWDQDDPYEMGGDHCFIPGGNDKFVKALAEDLPIFYERTVNSIRYGVDGVMVYANGQEFRGDILLCTVPLGVLKKGSIEFVPELPQRKKDAINRLGYGLLNKVAMLFPYNFWGGEIDTFGHLTEDASKRGEFFLFYSYSTVSGGPLLVALVAGDAAIKFELMSPVESVKKVLEILRGIYHPKGIVVPDPVQAVCTRWGKDCFTYGSYSYVAIGSSGDDYDILAENVGDKIFFAGEATNRQYPATMHGAFLSGMREAANILRVARKNSLADKLHNDSEESEDDLKEVFKTCDMTFGGFCVLFDPISDDVESQSLLRFLFEEEKKDLSVYCLISRKQAIELSELEGDGNRMNVLCEKFGAKLVGRKGLCNGGESLIKQIKERRSILDVATNE
ncbi:hypothetical protein ACFE04_025579 [Oxalis oulophora]